MSRVLITGGSGFIGTNLVEHYQTAGHQVVNLDSVRPRNESHEQLWVPMDLLDAKALALQIAEFDPEIVFHFAARTDLRGSSVADYLSNTQGVVNMIEPLKGARNLRLAVFASSMLVCRMGYRPTHPEDYCPSTPYGESKVQGERMVRQMAGEKLPWVMVRPTSIWGPWFGTPYRDFFNAIQRGYYFHPKNRRIQRSYGFVKNSVAQLARLAELGGGPLLGQTIYMADPQAIDLKKWADLIQQSLGVRKVREAPLGALRVLAMAGDVAKKLGWAAPPLTTFRLNNLITDMIHDTSPWQEMGEIAYLPLEEGVAQTCQWMMKGQS